jgi:hypothetical protein
MRTDFGLAVAIILALAVTGSAQSPRGKTEATIGGAKLAIDYGRPSLAGRDMLAKAPAGMVWRLGADRATVLETGADLVFDALVIPKGSYTLFAKRVDEKNWALIFNEQTGQWGTQRDPAMDFGSTPLAWEQKDDSTEQFTIEIASAGDGGKLQFLWGTNVLTTKFQAK